MEVLHEKLKIYHEKNIYPFHMPGHKRNEQAVDFLPGLTMDITEIDGFDDLNHPTGILKESQEAAAKLYGAEETYYSVNGSTGGLLAAIGACTTYGGTLLMARNCHRSVYHGACLGGLRTCYLYPDIMKPYGVNGPIRPEEVETALEAYPDIQAVVITSPTYEGVVSPVAEIARIVHSRRLPLIVDEAHGAHFPFHSYFPEPALDQGADVVVHSLHKTLPSLTQTALLHVKGGLADREKICRYMGMYQTSSPSYLLTGSIDGCIRQIQSRGDVLFEKYAERLKGLREGLSQLRYIHLAGQGTWENDCAWDYDPSKLVLGTRVPGLSGHEFYERLLREYGLQMEMEEKSYVLAMTSVADTEEGYERLRRGLEDMEKSWEAEGIQPEKLEKGRVSFSPAEQLFSISEAMARPRKAVPFWESQGRAAGEFLYLYPPGVPLAVPGERISREMLEALVSCQEAGLKVQGLKGEKGRLVPVIES